MIGTTSSGRLIVVSGTYTWYILKWQRMRRPEKWW